MDYRYYYHIMVDGTVKQVNPFTETEVWTVPGRWQKVHIESIHNSSEEIPSINDPEDYCAFCASRYFETTPEKARIVRRDGNLVKLHSLSPSDYFNEKALFRRVSNMFEIVSIDYWRNNYNYKLSNKNQVRKEEYISNPDGLKHVLDIIDYKLRRAAKSDEEIMAISNEEKLLYADAFFGGGHEIIIVGPHFKPDAKFTSNLFSTGDLSEEEHFNYFTFIIDAMSDIIENNRYVRYISIFKNWLKPAGATFDHLHTQLVAIDEWGEAIERQIKMIINDKNVFNIMGPNFAAQHNLVFAENSHAIAFIGIGHRFPTLEIYSKSVNARPQEHTPEEIRGMSDLVRACHKALGSNFSVNEEWYYTPIDSIFKMPWHVFIKLRINIPAGFEGGTNIYINPLSPLDLRDLIVPSLFKLRAENGCDSKIQIAEECRLSPNPLNYYKNT